MQEKLIINLHANDLSHPSWSITTPQITEAVSQSEPTKLAELAEEREVIVIVPGEDVLLTSAKLPKMNRTRLMQALPFALEEQVIAEVDSLHFAAGEYLSKEDDLAVAIVARTKMQSWLDLLQSWDVKADKIIPDFLALPYEENNWQIALSEKALVRTGIFQGFSCEKNNLKELCQLALNQNPPQKINVRSYQQETLDLGLDASLVNQEIFSSTQLLKDFSQAVSTFPTINLLQGAYATKKSRFPQRNKLLKFMACFAAVWVGFVIAYPVLAYFILAQRVNNIDAQIAVIYKRNFPQATSIVAPKIRLEEKLQKLSNQHGENRLLLLLGLVGKDMAENPTIRIKRFDFQNNQLTLEMMANSSEDFSMFTDYLHKQGLTVKQQNANLTDAHINATLLIE